MTSAESRRFYETTPPPIARDLLEGKPLRVHAAKVSVVREGDAIWFAIDTLPRSTRPDEWEKTTHRICQILKSEVDRMPVETKRTLAAAAHLLPDDMPLLLFQIESWLSMKDDGGSWWEVPAYLSLAAISLPAVVDVSERAKRRVLRVVTQI
ncbi:MAG: hypothetical protein WC277_10605 [Bacilli bacterium]|jgi:hypothetical protein